MLEAFKIGFAYAGGVIAAAALSLALWGLYDWAAEWVGRLRNMMVMAKARRRKG